MSMLSHCIWQWLTKERSLRDFCLNRAQLNRTSIHSRNKDRQTLFQKVSKTGNQEIMELLREHILRQ